MGKGRHRSVESGQNSSIISSKSCNIPPAPVYYPNEDEFKDPLKFIYKIRAEAEAFGICKIVPPKSWKPPFALDLDSFAFPTKAQAIHRLQVRPASCDSDTFDLEYGRFLEEFSGRKGGRKRVVFEGGELDLCRLFNAVKRFGGYDRVVKEKKWGDVFRFLRSGKKMSECAKHVLCQLYREHLYDYEVYHSKLNQGGDQICESRVELSSSKRRGKNRGGERVEAVKTEEEEFDQICEQCRSGLHGEVMLLCDRCNKGWHLYCLSPPLDQIPPGNWYCFECLNSEKDCFGFVPGRRTTLESFRRVADRAKRKFIGSAITSRVQLEKKFWEIVEGSAGEVEVKYGSDLDTSVYGSGFPRVNDQRPLSIGIDAWDEYCASPWNLNNLPKLQGSMLRAVHNSIAGVMVPWLYIGMLFSSFCWHFEDHCFYSMNYLHWGEPKCWYSVPGSEACAFEKVMRNNLPDLFDAQPDLLFQLVTMLNPSVLRESNVPVYSVLQEPGNFVITFPRSYHGGFNFGLNCAEAVNFAPADWLPHGGYGAELYQLYRKAAVLSHEELLCAVAKTNFDSEVSPYLKKELLRIYDKEKTWRERLWRNGILHSSPMSPQQQPKFVGVEEDPTCIICQQFLYLSAVICSCRPSAFVCLEHWEHLCECKTDKHRLLYRHTLVELNDLVRNADIHNSVDIFQDGNLQGQQVLCHDDLGALSKKIKGGHVTLVQLAEEWLLKSCRILQVPYSSDAFANALKEAEQFLWGDSEMDPVRDMTRRLIEAQNWAEGVRDCVFKLESWSKHHKQDMERVQMSCIRNLLSFDPAPCNEPKSLKLKVYQQEAELLIREINSALSMSDEFSIVEWENLYTKACGAGVFVDEREKLLDKLSFVKTWIHSVRKCISKNSTATVEVDTLEKLKSEASELHIQIPEIGMFWDLIKEVESCQFRCNQMLKGSICLKNLELFLREMDGFTVNLPELELLRQYKSDAMSWISRFNDVVHNVGERYDQETVVDELTCIKKTGMFLKIQVDELEHVDVELQKACCRVKALKALRCNQSLDSIQLVLKEATTLQIEEEKLFADITEAIAVALSWEEKAKHILSSEAQMSDFEDLIRTSEIVSVIPPSLKYVKEALSMATSWLNKSKPFLSRCSSAPSPSDSLLNFESLKELVSQSKLMKISLGERSILQTILDDCIQWELSACSLLKDMEFLLNINDISNGNSTHLVSKIERQVASLECVTNSGLCLHFDFVVTLKLKDACSTLQWCLKALSFCDVVPAIEEVEMLLEASLELPGTYASCNLRSSLTDGMTWLKRSLEIVLPCNLKRFNLTDAEEVIQKSEILNVSFPMMVGRLLDAIEKHKLWLDQVQRFFGESEDRSWFLLLQLKELGSTNAFSCLELDVVFSEVEAIEKWRRSCEDIVGSDGNKSLLNILSEIKCTLDRSLSIYNKSKGCEPERSCIRCAGEIKDQKLLTCSICNDCYHLQCIKKTSENTDDSTNCTCPCDFLKNGNTRRSGIGLKTRKKGPELNKLVKALSDADCFRVWTEERDLLQQIVEKAHTCRTYLIEVVDFVLEHLDEDFNIVAEKLSSVLKAVETSDVYDYHGKCKLDLALARNSWRVRACKLLDGPKKPTIQQIQRHLKEGSAINIPLGDHFRQKLAQVKHNGMQWADRAKKVSLDSGALELEKVFDLIMEGRDLLIDVEKDLQLLQDRSMLYCICRKPYDQRAMIACDICDEWYHFDCIKLNSAPKVYICPACKLEAEEDLSASVLTTQERPTTKCEEPQTPSPRQSDSRRRPERDESPSRKRTKLENANLSSISRLPSGIGSLFWRNRKPFRRVAKKREELDILSPRFHAQQL